jgi:LemA protein
MGYKFIPKSKLYILKRADYWMSADEVIVILLAMVLIVMLFPYLYYNRFRSLLREAEKSLRNIDFLMKRRAKLVAKLVGIFKFHVKGEKRLVENVLESRKSFSEAKDLNSRIKAGHRLDRDMGILIRISLKNPKMRKNESFFKLIKDFVHIENELNRNIVGFDESIGAYNYMTERAPGKWLASKYGYKKKDYFMIPQEG